MSLVKLGINSNFLSIKIIYNKSIEFTEINDIILFILNKYCRYLRWNIIKIKETNNNINYLNYYIYLISEIIDLSLIDLLIQRHFLNVYNNKLYIYYGCCTRKQFNKELKIYSNDTLTIIYKDKIWKKKYLKGSHILY